MYSWEILRWNILNCKWWEAEGNSVPWREWESARGKVTCVSHPVIFRWAFTGDYWWLLKAGGGNGGDRRKRGLSSLHVRGCASGSAPRAEHWLRHCSPWRRILEVRSACPESEHQFSPLNGTQLLNVINSPIIFPSWRKQRVV